MSEKKIKARLQQKHDTSANWALATNFKPKAGELIIYDDLKKMKVGDGETLVNNLPFLSADVSQDLNNYVNLTGNQTISGTKTFTGDITVDGGTFKVSKTDSANKTMSAVYGSNAITYTPYGSTSQKLISLPSSDGTIALTKDIPSISNLVTTNTDQTISGTKTFTSHVVVANANDLQNKTDYEYSGIVRHANNVSYSLLLPNKSGLIALTSDIPSTSSFVTVSGDQTISGAKTFTGTIDIEGEADSGSLCNVSVNSTGFIRYYEEDDNTEVVLNMPITNSGTYTIATTDDVNKILTDSHTFAGYNSFTNTVTGYAEFTATNGTNLTDRASLKYNCITRATMGATYTLTLPTKTGTIALTSDIPSISNLVTTNTAQTISGTKTFTSGNIIASKTDASNKTMKVSYGPNGIAYTPYGTTSIHLISFPAKDGTFALTSDIPSLTNYVTIDTAQTITGIKTFNAPTDVSGQETITTKFKTSNGGALIIGKEGQNSGTMLRFDQVDGTCRLRFRASATAGAMVWEQPEKNAALYFDMGNSAGSGKNRVTLRNVAGTLALTKELPAAVSANPTLSGSETELTGLQIGSAKYKVVTQTYVDNAIGNIDTLLTALNTGTGV